MRRLFPSRLPIPSAVVRLPLLLVAVSVAVSGLAPGPAAAQLGLPSLHGDGVEIPVSRDSEAAIRADLESREADFLQRLDGEQTRSRWQLERLENRRTAAEKRERALAARLSFLRRLGAPKRTAVLAQLLSSTRELDELLHETEEALDVHLRALLAASTEARRLRGDLDEARGEAPGTTEAIDEALDALAVSLQQIDRRMAKLNRTRTRSFDGYQQRRQSLSSARARLLYGGLHGHVLEEDLGAEPGSGGGDGPAGEGDARDGDEGEAMEPMSPEEQELVELKAELARLEVRLLESHSDVDRLRLELLALDVEREEMKLPVLRNRTARLESHRDDVAARERGGLLNVSPGLLDTQALAAGMHHTRELLANPKKSLAGVGGRLVFQPRHFEGQHPGLILLGLALLGLLAFVLVRRVSPMLRQLQPQSLIDQVVLAMVFGLLPFLPLSLICGTLAVAGLVPHSLTPLYRFAAIAPPVAASVLAVAGVLFPDGGETELRPEVARYFRRLLRLGTALAVVVMGVSVLLPLLGYPEEVRGLVRAGFVGWLLLGWLGITLRRNELLTLMGAQGDVSEVGLIRAGIRRFYRVLMVAPVVLYVLYAIGYVNLARFLVRGGVVTGVVLLLVPWAHLRLRELCERLLGYPDGGGLLALSPAGARTGYRTLAPLLLLGIGGASATLLASGWGYGHLVGNLSSAVSYPLLDVGGSSISAGSILLFALTIAVTFLFLRWVLGMLQRHLYPIYDLDRGMRTTLDTLVRYAIVTIGVIIGLDVVGVGIGFLTVFAGVVGIGVGFGSQTLAHNFISGLILLVTRPAAVDDVIEVDGIVGRVVRISSYATVVRTLDNLLVIVPNSRILDGQLVNWTVGDKRVRLAVSVGVAYGSDVDEVRKLLLASAEAHPRVLRYPAPIVRFDDFGDSSLVFTVLPWTDDPDNRFVVCSDLRFRIDAAFREAGVEIAFPQQDVHLRTGDGVLKVAFEQGFEVRDEDGETLVHADLARQRARGGTTS